MCLVCSSEAGSLLRTTFLVQRTEFAEGARFEPKFVYPEQACREALINAIAHRDYSTHSGVEIFVYDDRMEVKILAPCCRRYG